jgi:hypothetical protein
MSDEAHIIKQIASRRRVEKAIADRAHAQSIKAMVQARRGGGGSSDLHTLQQPGQVGRDGVSVFGRLLTAEEQARSL